MFISTRLLTVGGTALALALTTMGVSPVAQAAVSVPAPLTKPLPVAVDAQTPYMAQVSCDPRPKPGVTAFAALMKARYLTGAVGMYRPCQGETSEHYDGRALDWMNNVNDPRQKAIADSVTTWLSANKGVMARRFGISYIIWNKRMWREYAPDRGWTAYTGVSPHTDHVHLSFSWDGAMKRTSWWTGKATTAADLGPCRVYAGQFAPLYKGIRTTRCLYQLVAAPASAYKVAVYGQRSAQIALAQKRLAVPVTGQFGDATFTKLVAWQTWARIPVTGVLDNATWWRFSKPLPAPKLVLAASRSAAPPVWPATTVPLTAYRLLVLKQGSRGAAVFAVQRKLRLTADGVFGPLTAAAVKRVQGRAGLAQTGVVSGLTWTAIINAK